jgi:5-formyltetrahydrofolate cyclo-ligase
MSDPAGLAEAKRAARAEALRRRAEAAAGSEGLPRQAAGRLLAAIAERRRGACIVSAYLATGSELDPMPAMQALHGLGYRLCVPVTGRPGTPLRFREWRPGVALIEGALRIPEPAEGALLVPELLVVPLLAFDRRGYRLGYGGGFYDRTLAGLRAEAAATAVGYGFAAQEVDAVLTGPHDEPLDAIVTEAEVVVPA